MLDSYMSHFKMQPNVFHLTKFEKHLLLYPSSPGDLQLPMACTIHRVLCLLPSINQYYHDFIYISMIIYSTVDENNKNTVNDKNCTSNNVFLYKVIIRKAT